MAVSAAASKSVKTAIERQSKEVSLAQTNNFLGIYGGLVSMCFGMSGKRRERIASRMEQAPRRLALGDRLARESPMSPVPIPLGLWRAASGRAAVHPATALSSDLGRAAWRAGSGSGAAFASHGVVSHFSLPPGWFTAPTMAWPPSFTFTC